MLKPIGENSNEIATLFDSIYITCFYRKSKIYVDSLSKEGQRIEEVSLE
jgi:hypothetical protein